MSHADFDVVTGPSMPQRQLPLRQDRPSGSSDATTEPAAQPPSPAAPPSDAEEKRR